MIIHMDLHLIFLPGDLLVEVHMVDHLGAGMMKVIHHRGGGGGFKQNRKKDPRRRD